MSQVRLPDTSGGARAGPPGDRSAPRSLTWAATALLGAGLGLLVAVAALGPSVVVPRLPAALPWPPYFATAGGSEVTASALAWLAAGLGGAGAGLALLAVRRGWRPSPARLIADGLLAAAGLLLTPPVGSNDITDYAVYGRGGSPRSGTALTG